MFAVAFVSGAPTWLLAGLFLGVLFGLLILGVFLAGERFLPAANRHAGGDGENRGETLRREEIRYYLDAIGETATEDAVVEGREVAFFLPDRDVAVTFDARTYLLLRDSSVHPILVEHEMPGVHLGTRLPFETPDAGFGPDREDRRREPGANTGTAATEGPRQSRAQATVGGPDPVFDGVRDWRDDRQAHATEAGGHGRATDAERVRTAYAVLGLPPSADAETVRSAYRERVKEVHPDHGGDREAFVRLQEALSTVEDHVAATEPETDTDRETVTDGPDSA